MPPKGKKKAKFASIYSQVEIKDSFTEEMEGAIEVEIRTLRIQEGEVSLDSVGRLTVSHGNHMVGKVDDISFPAKGGEVNINYKCYLEICQPDNALMDALVSTPFFFTLSSKPVEIDRPQQTPKKGKASPKKPPQSASFSSKSLSEMVTGSRVIGQGNLDILPLIQEGSCDETVILEVGGVQDTLFFARSFSENPSLRVCLTDVKGSLASVQLNNILWLTVESIFNPSESHLTDDADYTVVFPVPLLGTKIDLLSTEESTDGQDKLRGDGKEQYDNTEVSNTMISYVSSEESISSLDELSVKNTLSSSKYDTFSINSNCNLGIHSDSGMIEQTEGSAGNLCFDCTTMTRLENRNVDAIQSLKNNIEITQKNPRNEGFLTFDASSRQTIKSSGAGKQKRLSRAEDERTLARASELLDRLSEFSLLEFPQGRWSDEPEYDLRKAWLSLTSINGGPSKHIQQIEPDSRGIFSKFPVDLQKGMNAEFMPKIVWNMVRPFWLTKIEQQNMIQKIFRYGRWPVEIVVDGGNQQQSDVDEVGGKKRNPTAKKQPNPRSYIAWLDLSPLLFPGNNSIRVAGQLQLFDKKEAEYSWGLKSTFTTKPADTLSLHNTESANDIEIKRSPKKGGLKRDCTKISQNMDTSQRSTHNFYVSDGSTESTLCLTTTENNKGNKRQISDHENESKCSSETPRTYEGGKDCNIDGQLQLDSTNKYNEAYENKPAKMVQLENEYSELKAKYDKLLAACGGKNIYVKYSERSSSDSDDSNQSSGETKKMMDIIKSEAEETELHKLLQAKDALETWTVLEHKKCLMERHALAMMRKKMKEELVLFEGEKLFNENAEPTFIVIEIKLLKPLIPKKSLDKIEADVRSMLPDRSGEPTSTKRRYTSKDFETCLAKLISVIHTEYLDFTSFNKKTDERGFYEHLVKSRAHQKMSEMLRDGMASYVKDYIGTPLNSSHIMGPKNKDYVGWLYCRLLDEIHTVVNNYVLDNDLSTPLLHEDNSPNISYEDLLLFATEAAEEKDHHRVKFYMSKILSGDGLSDAKSWSDYAVIALRLGDYPKAVECLREALLLDIRHKESLLMYAVILTMAGMFDTAEVFFYALMDFHPFFTEGWITFYMFYLLVEKNISADAALIYGTKCGRDLKPKESYKPPQLAWDNSWNGDLKSYYMKTAVYLLSFNLYEMAEVCLAQELELTGEKSETFIYYLAVCHHIQGRYQDSCSHLSRALSDGLATDADPRLWIIFGHNMWEMGEKKEAIRLYMQAFSCEEPPENPHMTYIRSGYYFLEMEKPSLAQQMFLRAVKNIGTPMGWLGLGIALYMLGNLEEAELALKEANTLDNRLAVAWAYLGLICLHNNKIEQYQQCIHEAKRHGLNDETLRKKIDDCMNKDKI